MSGYWCWCPSRGQTADDAVEVRAYDSGGKRPLRVVNAAGWAANPHNAAEVFANLHAGFDGDPFEEIDVAVAYGGDVDGAHPTVKQFVVRVRAEPLFTAEEKK